MYSNKLRNLSYRLESEELKFLKRSCGNFFFGSKNDFSTIKHLKVDSSILTSNSVLIFENLISAIVICN
jgi:hypothetical protein